MKEVDGDPQETGDGGNKRGRKEHERKGSKNLVDINLFIYEPC